ncbi:glycosyltransferase family 4 protein [Pseudanabaenaceae cyanobacterium LEGE 13415]|nr:glycosyltransferase family 4 protein [Pseudanabaenaceae cyanobacterium LEGE 13415]
MRVLHINHSDTYGGAAIAGYRLHQGLLQQGVDSRLLVGRVKTESDRVSQVPPVSSLEHQLERVTRKLGFNYIHQLSSFQILQHPVYQSAEVLNFHNLHTHYFNYLSVPSLVKQKPAVWTLHDMWAMTGHCAYSYACDRWKIGCGECPDLKSYPSVRRDSTRWEWKLKQWVYQHSNLSIVAPSRWLYELAKQSLLDRFPIHYIPNGIDTETYSPRDRNQCRAELGIEPNRKVLLFISQSLKDLRKGGDLLLQAIQQLPASLKSEILLVTLGEHEVSQATFGIETLNLGYIDDDAKKVTAFSAADLFVFPTRADNLPLVLQESLACGTPMVSCRIGGVPDLVRPGETGYLAAPEDAGDLSRGIVQLLEQDEVRDRMRQTCREIALREYAIKLQVDQYSKLYYQLLTSVE